MRHQLKILIKRTVAISRAMTLQRHDKGLLIKLIFHNSVDYDQFVMLRVAKHFLNKQIRAIMKFGKK